MGLASRLPFRKNRSKLGIENEMPYCQSFSTIFLIVKIEFVELEFFFLGVSFQSLSRKWYVNSDDDGNLFLKIFSSDIEDLFINSTIFMIFSIYNDKKRRNLVNCI